MDSVVLSKLPVQKSRENRSFQILVIFQHELYTNCKKYIISLKYIIISFNRRIDAYLPLLLHLTDCKEKLTMLNSINSVDGVKLVIVVTVGSNKY